MNKILEYICGVDLLKYDSKTDAMSFPQFVIGRLCPLGLEGAALVNLFSKNYSTGIQAIIAAESLRVGEYFVGKIKENIKRRKVRLS